MGKWKARMTTATNNLPSAEIVHDKSHISKSILTTKSTRFVVKRTNNSAARKMIDAMGLASFGYITKRSYR